MPKASIEVYLIDSNELALLRRVASRLFTEDRLSGDEMRDMAQALDTLARRVAELPVETEEHDRGEDD
jgi:hypothetical protein